MVDGVTEDTDRTTEDTNRTTEDTDKVTILGLDAATPGTRGDKTIGTVGPDATQEADKDTGTNGGAKGIIPTIEVIDGVSRMLVNGGHRRFVILTIRWHSWLNSELTEEESVGK